MNKIEWIILTTDNFQQSRNFYKNLLNFKIEREIPQEEFVQFKLDNCYLAIYGRKQVEKLLDQKIKKGSSAIYTLNEVKDVNTEYKKLLKKGIKFIKKPETQSWGQRTAYFIDPDGHIWEIQSWIKK